MNQSIGYKSRCPYSTTTIGTIHLSCGTNWKQNIRLSSEKFVPNSSCNDIGNDKFPLHNEHEVLLHGPTTFVYSSAQVRLVIDGFKSRKTGGTWTHNYLDWEYHGNFLVPVLINPVENSLQFSVIQIESSQSQCGKSNNTRFFYGNQSVDIITKTSKKLVDHIKQENYFPLVPIPILKGSNNNSGEFPELSNHKYTFGIPVNGMVQEIEKFKTQAEDVDVEDDLLWIITIGLIDRSHH